MTLRQPSADRAVHAVLDGTLAAVLIRPDGRPADPADAGPVVVPGSFNPLHHGHLGLAAAAEALIGAPAGSTTFELAVHNVDKPALAPAEVARRLAQFGDRAGVVVTGAPRFDAKAVLLPGRILAVGYDTAVRLLDRRYYASREERDAALDAIARQGCRIAVAGRLHDQRFCTLADLDVPPAARGLFLDLPETAFRADVSSTELRGAARGR